MKKVCKPFLAVGAFFFLVSNVFAEEKCKEIFSAKTLFNDKEVSLCREGDNITYEVKSQNSDDSIIKVTSLKNNVYVSGEEHRKRVYIKVDDMWYALDSSLDMPLVWGYEAKNLDPKRRLVVSMTLRESMSLIPETVKFDPTLIEDLEEFDQ